MSEDMEKKSKAFFEKHCDIFEDSDENKLGSISIENQYAYGHIFKSVHTNLQRILLKI